MTTAPTHGFTEQAFSTLAAAIDEVPAGERELFLAKLVILLTARTGDPTALADCIRRAAANPHSFRQTETKQP